jgi:hypothetical protein
MGVDGKKEVYNAALSCTVSQKVRCCSIEN